MKKIVPLLFVALTSAMGGYAQMQEYVQEGEFGFTIGAAHYFGDLNNRMAFNRPKIAAGVFFRRQFTNYTAVRLSGNFALIGYSDKYSKNEYR